MGYWGDDVDDCDYAFDAVGAVFFRISDRMFKDAETVIAKRYPEQAITASLCCLRLLGERFPRNLSVHFGKRELERARKAFDQWQEAVKDQLPPERHEAIKLAADREFLLFEERILRVRAKEDSPDSP
jgi:hypothetical protein